MKRPALLLGLAIAPPSAAWAQIPIGPAAEPARAPAAATPAPSADPPAQPAAASPGPAPGDQYYLDAAPPPIAPTDAPPAIVREPPPFEPPVPPPPGFEPPPPPEVWHLAPRSSLWLGARLGWFFPFGNAWARATPVSTGAGSAYTLEGVPWRDYASSGPLLELNAGLRFARAYTLFALWERAQLGSGRATTDGEPDGAETDFWAVGLRAASNPDALAFVTEVAVGYRRARSFYTNDVEVQFTDAPFEARLGLGAEYRMSRLSSISSLVTIGVGGFGTVEKVGPNGHATPKLRGFDQGDGHGWVTLDIGAHFDLLPSKH